MLQIQTTPHLYIIDNTDSGSHLGGGMPAAPFCGNEGQSCNAKLVQPSLMGLLGTDAESAELSHAMLLHLPKCGKEKQKHSTDEIQLPQNILHKDSELQDSANSLLLLKSPAGRQALPPSTQHPRVLHECPHRFASCKERTAAFP